MIEEKKTPSAYSILTNYDWDMILKGAKTVTLQKDDVIITQGEKYKRIYQINQGQCRIEVQKEGKTTVLGRMIQGETFGNFFNFLTFLTDFI